MGFLKTLRKVEKIRFYAGLLIIGLFFILLSCIGLSRPEKELSVADGTILRIESHMGPDGETQNQVFVSYTDSAGVLHEGVEYPSYSSSMKKGDTVEVRYDINDPENISAPGGRIVLYVVLIIGILALAASVFSIVKGASGRKESTGSPFEDAPATPDPVIAEQIRNDFEPAKNYYFHWTGKLNQSYILETCERVAVFEAICDHIGVFTPYRYTFADRRSGKTVGHKVTHTVTKRYGSGTEHAGISVVDNSYFKIDDENIWDYLHRLGYSVVPQRSGIKLNFDILHGGIPVAHLEAAGTNILSDSSHSKLGDKLPGTGLFKVSCRDADVEAVFTACFCVSRVEFF